MKVRRTGLALLLALLLAAPLTLAAAPQADGPCSPGSALQGDCSIGHLLSALLQAVLGPEAVRAGSTDDPPDGSTELGPGMGPLGGSEANSSPTDPDGGATELRPDMDPAG
ncbi:MAG TPA: hypothetical protein VHQ65_02160 [Thermoanaerobaculia bacterium]|nr:hypothetical protein [Thermoanaerobaculia bacterium]